MATRLPEGQSVSPRKIEPKTELGRRLLAFVARKGFTGLKAASESSGVHYQQLYDIASGIKMPRVDTLESIVMALGGTMHEFYDPTLLPSEK